MKFLWALMLVVSACQQEGTAETKTEFTRVDNSGDSQAETSVNTYRYARYVFALEGYQDVNVAVRLKVDANNVPQELEIKDLQPDREQRAVEKFAISKVEENSSDTAHAFTGTSTLTEGDRDYGGTYTGAVSLNEGVVAEDGCCGEMSFVPTLDEGLTFVGTKQEPAEGETYAETWWNGVTACKNHQLVFSQQPPASVTEDVKFDLEVTWQCDGDKVAEHDEGSIKLYFKSDSHNDWQLHRWRNNCPDDQKRPNVTNPVCPGLKFNGGKKIYKNMVFANLQRMLLVNYKYQAIVTIDGKDYSAESTEINRQDP